MPIGSILIIILLCAVYAALLLWLLRCTGTPRYVPVKAACSAAFVTAAILFASLGTAPARLWMLLPGFVFCAVGDILLALYNLNRKAWQILTGTLLFLAGHCSFFAAFCARVAVEPWDFALPTIAAVAVVGLMFLPKMEMHGMQIPAVIYSFVVALMCGKAVGVAATVPAVATVITAVGAVSVMLSDAIILFQYFYAPAKKSRTVHTANLLTYYLGILLMAAGLLG